MANNIQHISGDDNIYYGSFIKTNVSKEDTLLSINVEKSCKLEFSNNWLYNGIYMFNSDRSQINDHDSKVFDISKNSSNFFNSLEPISLSKNSNDVVFDENRLSTDMSALLESYTTDLTDRNMDVQNEISLYNTDVISKNLEFAGKNIYTGPSNYEQFVNILNGAYNCDTSFGVQVKDSYKGPGDATGVEYKQALRLGVSDKNITV